MKLKKCVVELQFLPTIAFFQQLAAHDEFLIEKCENYQKKSFRNKARILSANGVETISIPLRKGKNNKTLIDHVLIADDHPWRAKVWHAIVSAYRNAPYFIHYEHKIKNQLFDNTATQLFDWNMQWIELILKLMKADYLRNKIKFTQEYLHQYDKDTLDYRNKIMLNQNSNRADFKRYEQVFADKFDFVPNLSILDLLFCYGPNSIDFLIIPT